MLTVERSLRRAALVLPIVVLAGCARESAPAPRTALGECGDVFGGQVCTWGTVAGTDVVEFGATIPMATINGAPAEGEMVWPPQPIAVLRLPDEVRTATGFDHLSMNWEPHGHPPALFLTPHFDFHFFSQTPEAIAAIDCADLEKPAAAPAGYVLPDIDIPGMGTLIGLCVPLMGMHAMRTDQLEETDLFGGTMIVGYYDEALISVEPMISQAMLRQARSFTLDVPQVPDAGVVTEWPGGFQAVFDEATQAYRFVFRTATTE